MVKHHIAGWLAVHWKKRRGRVGRQSAALHEHRPFVRACYVPMPHLRLNGQLALLHSGNDRLDTRCNTKFPLSVFNVIIRGILRDIENLADLPVGFSRSNPLQAFDLTIGQTHIVIVVVSHELTQIVVADPLQRRTQAPLNA